MKSTLFLILLFVAIGSHGQDTLSIDINEYARPDFKRSSLDLRPDLNFNSSYNPDRLSDKLNTSLQGGGSAVAVHVHNSRMWQSIYRVGGDMDLRSSSSGGSSVSLGGSFGNTSRYFHKDREFLILSSDLKASFQNRNTGSDSGNLTARVDVGYGFGRVEFVGDAVHVVRLMTLLKEEGVTLKDISTDEMIELIDLVALYKNQRFFDFRLQLIKETEAVLNYLSDKGIVDGGDFRTFALLKDAYDFEDSFQEFSAGKTLEFTVGRGARYDIGDGWQSAVDLAFDAVYDRFKMINNYTQTRIYGGLSYAYYRWDRVIDIRHRTLITPYIGYDVTYMPTVRVRLTWSNLLQHDIDLERAGTNVDDNGSMVLRSTAIVSYYVSPEVRVTANGSFNTRTRTLGEMGSGEDSYRLSISGGILYSIY